MTAFPFPPTAFRAGAPRPTGSRSGSEHGAGPAPWKAWLAALLLAPGLAAADMTRYGFTGIQYVPSAEKSYGPDLAAAFHMPVKDSWDREVYPSGMTLMASLSTWPVEIGLSNTYRLASSRDGDGFDPATAHDYLPVVPTVKYALAQTEALWGEWMAAGGFALPYGAYFSAGYRGLFWRLRPHVTGGLSSRYTTWHIFGGVELGAVDGKGRALPLYLVSDFALGNSLEQLDRLEERFWSVGVKMDAGQHLRLAIAYRRDGEYRDDGNALQSRQNPGLVSLSIQTYLNPLSRRSAK